MTYYYLAADKTTGGPETLEVLTGMVAAGTVSLATLVVPAGGEDWTPLARVLRYFYADAAGGTAGPVAFSELQRLNQTGVLEPGSWVLEEGAEQWKTLESVILAGGAEVFAPAPVATPAPVGGIPRTATGAYRPPGGRTQAMAADPYAPPRSGTHKVVVRHRRTGGMNRMQYFLYSLVLPFFVLVLMMAAIFGGTFLTAWKSPEVVNDAVGKSMVVVLIVGGILAILQIVFALQRLKNIGWPWYYIFLSLIPIVSIWLSLALLAWPPGYAHHKRFDTPAKVICALFAVFIVAGVIIAILAPKPKPTLNTSLQKPSPLIMSVV